MKNIWTQRWHDKHDMVFHIDWDKLMGDTIKERMEQIYVRLLSLYIKRGGYKIFTSPEAASIFDTGCRGFYPASPQDDQAMTAGQPYRITQSGAKLFENFWVHPSLKDSVYYVAIGNVNDPSTMEVIHVHLDNFVI